MGISINGPSGIDTASLTDQLVALEQAKVTTVQAQATADQAKIDDYSKLKQYFSDLQTKAKALADITSFDVFKTTSTNSDAVTISGGVGAVESNYDINVFQLAQNEKLISKDKQITSQTATLASQGINVGSFSIDGTTIALGANDTIQDLRMKINNATDSSGNKLGVTASVLKLSATDFRLVLTSKNSGAAGDDYRDVSGSTLTDLGILANGATGDKGNVTQVLTSANDIKTAYQGLSAGNVVQFSGTDHEGNAINGSFVVNDPSKPQDMLSQIENAFHGTVTASFDATTGNLVVTDNGTGASLLKISSLTLNGTASAVTATTAGQNGAGVVAVGKDAAFNVDGITMTSSKNTADGYITGVTINLLQKTGATSVQVGIARDTDALQQKVTDMLTSYNSLLTFANTETSYGDPTVATSTKGTLAGDMTVTSMVQQARNVLESSFGGTLSSLMNVGVMSDAHTGQMSLDSTKFQNAINNNFDDLTRLFTTNGHSSNSSISLGSFTGTTADTSFSGYSSDTKAGTYTITQVDAGHISIKLNGDSTSYTADSSSGVAYFTDGPAKGLMLNVPAGSLTVGASTDFTLSKGAGVQLDELIDKLSTNSDSMVSLQQQSLQSSIKSINDRVVEMQTRVDDYRLRLVNQFAAMEQALNQLRTQSGNMLTALGTATLTS